MFMLTESGVGAGIDSYYEYVLKAYILLGDDTYLERFNKVNYFNSFPLKHLILPKILVIQTFGM